MSLFNSYMANFAWFPEIIIASGVFSPMLLSAQFLGLGFRGVTRGGGFKLCRLWKVCKCSAVGSCCCGCAAKKDSHSRASSALWSWRTRAGTSSPPGLLLLKSIPAKLTATAHIWRNKSQVPACPGWGKEWALILLDVNWCVPIRWLNCLSGHQFLSDSKKIKGMRHSMCLDAVIYAKAHTHTQNISLPESYSYTKVEPVRWFSG